MAGDIFKFKSVNINKLLAYGFKLNEEVYEFKTDILNGDFELRVYVDKTGSVKTQVFDKKSREEYVLHLMPSAVGEFVGKVRLGVEGVLWDICDKCYEREVFKSPQSKAIIEYVKRQYGDDLEYLWEKFSNNAIWRRKDNNKWYGLMVVLPKNKLGVESDEIVEIMDLRFEPAKVDELVDNKGFFKAYHMNKKSWITICLDGSVETEEIIKYLDESYKLAKKK